MPQPAIAHFFRTLLELSAAAASPLTGQHADSLFGYVALDPTREENSLNRVKDGQDTYLGCPFSVWRLSVPGPRDVKLGGTGWYSAKAADTMNLINADLAMDRIWPTPTPLSRLERAGTMYP
jgi:hypothetical protein